MGDYHDDGKMEGGLRYMIIAEEFDRLRRVGCNGVACVSYTYGEKDRPFTLFDGMIDANLIYPLMLLLATAGEQVSGKTSGPFEINVRMGDWRYIVWMGPHLAWIAGLMKPIEHNTMASIKRTIRALNKRVEREWWMATISDALEQLVDEGKIERTEDDKGNPLYRRV